MDRLHKNDQAGFTLIEVIVVMAILGILAAILVPSVTGLLGKGDEAGLNGDVTAVDLAVGEFKLDRHAGPDGSYEWGTTAVKRIYPTRDGLVGDVELSDAVQDPLREGNYRLDIYAAGPTTGGTATDDNVTRSLVWMGLLVNEPFTQSGAVQQKTGSARVKTNEPGAYLPAFPASAHASNTVDATGTASSTAGSYTYVVMQNGKTVAAYKSGEAWYVGYNGVFP